MSTNCDKCGYRDNEVKSGGAISPQGKRIILKVEDKEDLSRDILKVCLPLIPASWPDEWCTDFFDIERELRYEHTGD